MIFQAIKDVLGLGRKIRDNGAGLTAATKAYDEGAGLEGVLVAYASATPEAIDDGVPEAVSRLILAIERTTAASALTLELASQTLGNAALELRELEALSARLRGGVPLCVVLESK